MSDYFRLDYVRDNAGLEPPAVARKKKKSYFENTKKPATSFSSFDTKYGYKNDSPENQSFLY